MRHNNLYTFIFISIVTIICAGLLSSAAYYLKDIQQKNVEVDMKKNILKAVFGKSYKSMRKLPV